MSQEMYFHWHGEMLALGIFQLSSRVWMIGQLQGCNVCHTERRRGAASAWVVTGLSHCGWWVSVTDTSKWLQTYPEKIMGGVILKTLRSMHIVLHCFSASCSFTVRILAECLHCCRVFWSVKQQARLSLLQSVLLPSMLSLLFYPFLDVFFLFSFQMYCL